MKITTFNKLRKYDNFLYTAKYADYIRSLTTVQVAELQTIGNELGFSLANSHCGKCILNFLKHIAEPYFTQKEKMENNKKTKQENTNEN